LRQRPKLEGRRQAKLHLVGSSGKRIGKVSSLAAAWLRPRMSRHARVARRRKAARGTRCDRESSNLQGCS